MTTGYRASREPRANLSFQDLQWICRTLAPGSASPHRGDAGSPAKSGAAEDAPQLAKQSTLLAGHLGGSIKAIFGRRGGPIRGLLEQNFAFGPQRFPG
jgi:hypothetical protein